jgi:hypothetical protein
VARSSLTLLLWAATPVLGAELEIEAALGRALPSYSETYSYFPQASGLNVPRLRLEQSGSFVLDAHGSTAWTAAAALYFGGSFGLEARLDSAQVDVSLEDVTFDVTASLPPLPPLSQHFELPSGVVQVDDVRPLSLNLKLRSLGPLPLTLSGGLSYLGELNAVATQPLGLGLEGIVGGRPVLAALALRATTQATEEGSGGKLGANLGLGLRIPVGSTLSVVAEARAFVFQKRRLVWSAAEAPSSPVEQELLEDVLERLPRIEFTPSYWRVTAGLGLRL